MRRATQITLVFASLTAGVALGRTGQSGALPALILAAAALAFGLRSRRLLPLALIPAFCGWLAWPAALLLGFITKLIAAFAALPWAGTTGALSLPAMLSLYALVLAATLTLYRANRRLHRAKINGTTNANQSPNTQTQAQSPSLQLD